MADSVLGLDANERIVLRNTAAARLLHYAPPLGRGLAEVGRVADLVGFARGVSDAGPEARLIELYVGAGERKWIQAVATRLPFFFQAEDGIRVLYVTGVQTCALPI